MPTSKDDLLIDWEPEKSDTDILSTRRLEKDTLNELIVEFCTEKPSKKVLYTNDVKILDVYKKYISINNEDKRYNKFIPILSLDLKKISFEKLAYKLAIDNSIISINELYKKRDDMIGKDEYELSEIYLNMPICTHGKILKKKSKQLSLKEFNSDLYVELSPLNNNFSIEKEKNFIENNTVFILGTIRSLEKKISIDVGAILI